MESYEGDGYQYKLKRGQWDISCRNICREALSTIDLLKLQSCMMNSGEPNNYSITIPKCSCLCPVTG